MIRVRLGLMALLLIITGCADPSPLRSNIEVEAMKEYRKEQTKEILTYDSKTKVLCSVKVCYDVPSAFHSEVIPNWRNSFYM